VYHLKRVFHPRPLPSRDTRATPDNPPRDSRVSDEVWECLQQDKAAAGAHEKEYKRLLKQEAALRESATAAEWNTESATAAATLEEATQHDADNEAKRRREEARLRHELKRRAREAELEALKRKRQTEERRRVALRFR